ncbi:MAG: zinc-ribbon domain-containing protein [Sulfurimonas sp.]|jgi:hypothetical protein
MALINCTECGKEISDKASTCPHCGAPVGLILSAKKAFEKKQQEEIEEREKEDERERVKRSIAEQKRKEEPLGNATSVSIGWMVGILLILTAIGSLKNGNIATSLIYLIGSLFLLPPVRKRVFQETQIIIPSAYRVGIVIGSLVFAMIAAQSAEASRAEEVKQKIAEEQAKVELQAKEIKNKKFQSEKNNLLKQVQLQIRNNDYDDALPICNEYMYLQDKDLSPLCQQVKDEIERKALIAQKILEKKEAKKQEAELKASMSARAWKVHKKHPSWDIEDCKNVSKGRYWIGMNTDMMVASLGRPNSVKPSNYGNGQQWQYCYTDGWFQCFYDQNDDGIIDSYN